MQSMQRAMTAYGQASETLAPARQIVMLYDGVIRRIKEARLAIEAGRTNDRYVALKKATAIVEGLHAGLDHERGGEIAANLDRIYTYVVFRLQRINLTDEVMICDELVERLGDLRASWAQLADGDAAATRATPTPSDRREAAAGDPTMAVTI